MKYLPFALSLYFALIIVCSNAQPQSTFYGTDAGINTTGKDNSFYGWKAGENNTIGLSNSFFGRSAGYLNTGSNNSFFGSEAGEKNAEGTNNSFFGESCGYENTGGSMNSFYGQESGHDNTIGISNTFLGYYAGWENVTGNRNVFVGSEAGVSNMSADENSCFGFASGDGNITGSRNTFIGARSGKGNIDGSYNVFIGHGSGNFINGSSNVIIGLNAGPELIRGTIVNESHRLYIDNETSNTPLIYGEFDNNLVRINGSFEAMGGMANNSDVNSKHRITKIDSQEILSKIVNLSITQWEYKRDEGVKHIGPMAQDFYAVFGLGAKETAISTVDTDGVMMAAIQALNEKLESENQILRDEITSIQSLMATLLNN